MIYVEGGKEGDMRLFFFWISEGNGSFEHQSIAFGDPKRVLRNSAVLPVFNINNHTVDPVVPDLKSLPARNSGICHTVGNCVVEHLTDTRSTSRIKTELHFCSRKMRVLVLPGVVLNHSPAIRNQERGADVFQVLRLDPHLIWRHKIE